MNAFKCVAASVLFYNSECTNLSLLVTLHRPRAYVEELNSVEERKAR